MKPDNIDWYKEWYQRAYEIYNSAWDDFMRDYVFAKDPPFKIVNKKKV